jgi:hypothetical protein
VADGVDGEVDAVKTAGVGSPMDRARRQTKRTKLVVSDHAVLPRREAAAGREPPRSRIAGLRWFTSAIARG